MSATAHMSPISPFGAVVVASSFGGVATLCQLAATFPADFPVPVLVAQHGGNAGLACLLDRRSSLPVSAARDGDPVPASGIVVVPAGTIVVRDSSGVRFAARPHDGRAADALFVAAATAWTVAIIGVVLTGRLNDGAQGVRAVKRRGGRILVQDPLTAAAPGMPTAALATGCVDFVLPLERMLPAMIALTMAPGAAALLTVAMPPWANHS